MSAHKNLGAQTSAHTSAHASLGVHMSAHTSANTSFGAHTSAHTWRPTSLGAYKSALMGAFLPREPTLPKMNGTWLRFGFQLS